ncbi:methyltransferase type 12 [Streptomyces mashuensis]|uniref:Methyltransferase type 12 n=1 Tax=Streptomyces mashuensis TaxID=33904 RepID=A0A919EFT8_9ACTN|nr:hypothetical protein [Streptomyces mashuensis]GHF67896.1 methyltransferase type 12 [Streptomyces mashuensis]
MAAGKTRFDDVYDAPDPRPYFRRLAPLRYEIPEHARPVFRRAAAARAAAEAPGGTPPAVLDLCSSYGINAALLNHDVTLAGLYERYTGPVTAPMTTAELLAADREFYAARRRPGALRVLGLDIAGHAVRYARAAGLLDEAHTDNLEEDEPGPELRRALAGVGLITVTGGGSYVTRRTFDRLLRHARRPVWVSAFVLRTVPLEPLVACFAEHGLHTRTDTSRTYPQRLFTDARERDYAVRAVRAAGGDPAGREEAGSFHAVLLEARPE